MKKISIIIAVFASIFTGIDAQAVKSVKVSSLLSKSEDVKVDAVRFSDDATIVSFVITGKEKNLTISKGIYLVDKHGLRHKSKSSKGLKKLDGDRYEMISNKFSFVFDKIDSDFGCVDVIGGEYFRFYGIHDNNNKVSVQHPVAKIDENETNAGLFVGKKTIITGIIHKERVRQVFCYMEKLVKEGPTEDICTNIDSNGYFKMEFELDHPLWTVLTAEKNGRQQLMYIYIRPGDQLNVEISEGDTHYTNLSGRPTYEKLMKQYPGSFDIWPDDYVNKMSRKEFVSWIDKEEQFANSLADYICWKYQLSPWETYLYQKQVQINFAALLLRYNVVLGQNIEHKKHHTGEEINTETPDYGFLKALDPDDITFCSLKYYYPVLCQLGNTDLFSKGRHSAARKFVSGNNLQRDIVLQQNNNMNEITGWNGFSCLMQGAAIVELADLEKDDPSQRQAKLSSIRDLMTHPYFRNSIDKMMK